MDNFALMCFLVWPGVVVGCALINMLLGWTFSWSELVLDYFIGVILGVVFMKGTEAHPGAAVKFFMVFSHGLPGLLHVWDVDHFHTREDLFKWAAGALAGGVVLAGALDRATVAIGRGMNLGGGLLSIVIFVLKAPWALFTSSVGLCIWVVGLVWTIIQKARKEKKEDPDKAAVGFLGGLLYAEWSKGTGDPYATTLGFVANSWDQDLAKALAHEMYHSRQYMYMRDWFIPFWLVGGVWGLVSSKIAGKFDMSYFYRADKNKEFGNPLERAAYVIE